MIATAAHVATIEAALAGRVADPHELAVHIAGRLNATLDTEEKS